VKIKRTRPAPSYLAGRNAIISRIARERNIDIISASRAVRAEGLWQRPTSEPEPEPEQASEAHDEAHDEALDGRGHAVSHECGA
jgi:hypothetical protein